MSAAQLRFAILLVVGAPITVLVFAGTVLRAALDGMLDVIREAVIDLVHDWQSLR